MKQETPPAVAKAKKPKAGKPAAANPAEGHEEAVRRMAYLLYEQRGCIDGYEVEDWLRAEVLVTGQAAASAAPARKTPKAAAPRAPAATKEPAAAAAKPRAAAAKSAPAAKRAPAKPRSE
jgi:hypothetical protein